MRVRWDAVLSARACGSKVSLKQLFRGCQGSAARGRGGGGRLVPALSGRGEREQWLERGAGSRGSADGVAGGELRVLVSQALLIRQAPEARSPGRAFPSPMNSRALTRREPRGSADYNRANNAS